MVCFWTISTMSEETMKFFYAVFMLTAIVGIDYCSPDLYKINRFRYWDFMIVGRNVMNQTIKCF